MHKYKVGEILIVHNAIERCTYMNGEEVEVVELVYSSNAQEYKIRFFNSEISSESREGTHWCKEKFLKRREPPAEDDSTLRDANTPVSWDEFEKAVGWRPKELQGA